ncbi:MAG: FAD binding domain-containing protein [Adhaeribacter sp.]
MHNFSYSRAEGMAAALQQKAASAQTRYLAGGTNLIDLMKARVERPDHLVDLRHLPLQQIEETPEGGLRLGALVTNADTAYHPQVAARYPLLAKAILAGASAQLRNRATNGGNPLQRTRCYYFYDTATACNKREPGSGCAAMQGFNRIHAILGASEHCIAVHPSDMAVALAALEARVHLSGPGGERSLPFSGLHRLPGDTPDQDHNLQPDELIMALELPAEGFADHHAYLKIRDRQSYAFALVSVAVGLKLEGDSIREARLVLGGVAHKPWRSEQAEALLAGKPATEAHFRQAAAEVLREAKGYGHNDFKIELAQRAIVRALQQAVEMKNEVDGLFRRSNSEPV